MIIIREKVKSEIIIFEYNFSNIGTIYITDVIEFICQSDNPTELITNLEKNVYIHIAKKYNKNVKTIKSDIIKATNNAYKVRCLKANNLNLPKKTAKTVISEIVDKFNDEKFIKNS